MAKWLHTIKRSATMMILLAWGIFGLCVGGFLNVVIVRKGRHWLSGRSACPSCAKTLAWYDMVPVASWIMLGGRCRTCGSPISIQYPLVEAATGIVFGLGGSWLLGP
jgi:prepilin signal peptidase PulO-like enzyme (type II secretory pathway)